MNNLPTNPGIFSAIKYAIVSLCSTLCKIFSQADSALDVTQDLIDTAKVHSNQLLEESKLESEQQLARLKSS